MDDEEGRASLLTLFMMPSLWLIMPALYHLSSRQYTVVMDTKIDDRNQKIDCIKETFHIQDIWSC